MAGVNKNFVIKNGLEVDTILILADADNNKVGINTNDIKYTLHVNGGIGATTLYATGISTFKSVHLDGTVIAGNAGIGSTGQYLVRVGTGVTWQSLPSTRSSQTFTATTGQTIFSFSYNIGEIDVFINGVKLSSSEYTANNGTTVVLNTACFGDETVELISYNSIVSTTGITQTGNLQVGTSGTVINTTSAGLIGINSTTPTQKLDVVGSIKVGINTSQGVILTSPNGTKYQLFVEDDGTLKTIAV